jgi:L-lactate dehydrogenase complex protein LldG
MSSREDILGRVRANLNRPAADTASARAVIDAILSTRSQGPRPAMPPEKSALAARFREKSVAQSSTLDSIADIAAAPAAVARYLAEMNLPLRAAVWPSLADLDWQAAGIAAEGRGAREGDLVGITGCFCAVAETGTLMLCSSPHHPATVSLLPETHIAIVPASRVVAAMEDAWALARTELDCLPRAVNFISGPSRTGDIEQTIVLGAHGPYRVHLIVVEDI